MGGRLQRVTQASADFTEWSQRLFLMTKQFLILAPICRYPTTNGNEHIAKFPS